jgi:hypothetical protein
MAARAMDVQFGTVRRARSHDTVVMQLFPPRAAGTLATINDDPDDRPMSSRLWYRGRLPDALLGVRHLPMIGEHFADALSIANWPDGACLFLSGSDTVFFSPAAIEAVPYLIVACGAEPSPPPGRACATLLVGRQSDWELLPRENH